MGDIGHGLEVDHFKRRVRHGFAKDELGIGANGGFPSLQIAAIDKGDLDAKPAQHILEDVETRAEKSPRRDDVIARLHKRHQRTVDCGHA